MNKLFSSIKNKAEESSVKILARGIGFRQVLNKKRAGAFAFEYIIVLVVMAAIIFSAWDILGDAVIAKAKSIANTIQNEGTGR